MCAILLVPRSAKDLLRFRWEFASENPAIRDLIPCLCDGALCAHLQSSIHRGTRNHTVPKSEPQEVPQHAQVHGEVGGTQALAVTTNPTRRYSPLRWRRFLLLTGTRTPWQVRCYSPATRTNTEWVTRQWKHASHAPHKLNATRINEATGYTHSSHQKTINTFDKWKPTKKTSSLGFKKTCKRSQEGGSYVSDSDHTSGRQCGPRDYITSTGLCWKQISKRGADAYGPVYKGVPHHASRYTLRNKAGFLAQKK